MQRIFKKSFVNKKVLVIGLGLILAGCNSAQQPSVSKSQLVEKSTLTEITLQWLDCWFTPPKSSLDIQCFNVHVPQNYDQPDGLWIKFSGVKLSQTEKAGKSPILHLGGGGPGNPMGLWPDDDVDWIFDRYQGFVKERDRDLYIIDPRGVGYTSPSLGCFEYADYFETALATVSSVEQENREALQAYIKCRQRFESQGVDFSYYNSTVIAQDMEALRIELNIPKWNLYGVSYGSRYAQVMAREYADTIDTMVLDAATFPDIKYTERSADDYLQTLERLFIYCEETTSCQQQLGDVRTAFWNLVEKLDQSPLEYLVLASAE